MTAAMLATRVMKARRSWHCARCGVFYLRGTRIGYLPGVGWCHVNPCIIGPLMPA